MNYREVVVVGAGSTGCSILYHLAKAGVKEPLLLDAAPQVAAGQTSRSTALVRTHYSSETLARMALRSYLFFKEFEREIPGKTAGYVETGLLVGADEASVGALVQNASMYRGLGIDSRIMTPDELSSSRIEPNLDTKAFSLFAYEPNAGYAEPSTTASSLAAAGVELGGAFLPETRVTGIRRAPGGRGRYSLETSRGTVEGESIVLATGVWSKPLFASMGVSLPLTLSRHPVAVFGRPAGLRGARPVVFDFPRSAYYKPEGNDLLFVGSLSHELDAKATDADPDDYQQGISYEEVADFSASASSAFPVMGSGGSYRRGYAGLYDNTPDLHPVIDELSPWGLPGVHCVVGLSGHGFKLAPEFGRISASIVVSGRFSDYDVSMFRLGRFDEGRLLSGRYGVSTIL